MKIYKNLAEFNVSYPVLTTGTFDGVHEGHQFILNKVNEIAQNENGESVLFTFWPHPRTVLYKDSQNLKMINSLDERIKLLERHGIKHLILFPFSIEFSKLTAEEFVRNILIEKIGIKHLIVGFDHHFGKHREGNFQLLQTLSNKYNFKLTQVEGHFLNKHKISSTSIREALTAGDIELTNKLLSYNYSLTGKVIEGNKIGRTIHFPTANIQLTDSYKLIPQNGVYIVNVEVLNRQAQGILNIGNRPTVNSDLTKKTIEVHILDFNSNIYGQKITIIFHKKIRNELKFQSLDKLKQQIEKDKQTALHFFQEN